MVPLQLQLQVILIHKPTYISELLASRVETFVFKSLPPVARAASSPLQVLITATLLFIDLFLFLNIQWIIFDGGS
jgi:hypothetical protein